MFVCHLVVLGGDGQEFMLTAPVFKQTRDLMAADTFFIVPARAPEPLTDGLLFTFANDQAFWATVPPDLPGVDDCRTP